MLCHNSKLLTRNSPIGSSRRRLQAPTDDDDRSTRKVTEWRFTPSAGKVSKYKATWVFVTCCDDHRHPCADGCVRARRDEEVLLIVVLWTLDGTTCGDGSRRGSGGGCETSGPIV